MIGVGSKKVLLHFRWREASDLEDMASVVIDSLSCLIASRLAGQRRGFSSECVRCLGPVGQGNVSTECKNELGLLHGSVGSI
jgi:hypothetical protein